MYSIIIIIPYFGKLPDHFPLWLNFCKYNSDVNWFFITDQDMTAYDIPDNITVNKSTLKELKDSFQSHFDFPISLEKPYKLCDYKPTYGEMFEKNISGFDFWGYSDIDLIYGNIRKFLTDEALRNNERMFVFGHLSIYKNNEKMRTLYRAKHGNNLYYKDVLSSPFSFAFDEFGYKDSGGMFQLCYDLDIKLYNEYLFAHIYEKPLKLQCDFGGTQAEIKKEQKKRNVYFEFSHGRLTQHWDNAGNGEKELCYLHIRLRKLKNLCTDTDRFYIYPREYTNIKKRHFNTFCINPQYIKWRIRHLLFYIKNRNYVKWRLNEMFHRFMPDTE